MLCPFISAGPTVRIVSVHRFGALLLPADPAHLLFASREHVSPKLHGFQTNQATGGTRFAFA